jgi:hypothetical protein
MKDFIVSSNFKFLHRETLNLRVRLLFFCVISIILLMCWEVFFCFWFIIINLFFIIFACNNRGQHLYLEWRSGEGRREFGKSNFVYVFLIFVQKNIKMTNSIVFVIYIDALLCCVIIHVRFTLRSELTI